MLTGLRSRKTIPVVRLIEVPTMFIESRGRAIDLNEVRGFLKEGRVRYVLLNGRGKVIVTSEESKAIGEHFKGLAIVIQQKREVHA